MMDFGRSLAELSKVMSVSSREANAHQWFTDLCKPIFDEVYADRNGTLICVKKCGKPDAEKLLLDAHLDEIGMVVTDITEKGSVKFASIGGIDAGILPASELIIYGKEPIRGIVAAAPPHLIPASQRGKKPDISSLYIDTGYTKEELCKIVEKGDMIGFDTSSSRLLNDRFYSKGLDDRACALCIIGAVELLKDKEFNYDIYVSLSVREETGSLGAVSTVYNIRPDIAIVVDVDHARLPGGEDKEHCEMGKGGSITYTDTLSRGLSKSLIDSARASGYPYQITAAGGNTGTNAHPLAIACDGVATVVLSLPLKNMHTPVEICSIKDMESVAGIIAEFASSSTFSGKEVVIIDR